MMLFDLSPEQQQLKETAHRFAAEEIVPVAAKHDEEQLFPAAIAKKAWEVGLMNLEIPTEYGGPGLGVLDTCLMLEELNYGRAGITNSIAANGRTRPPGCSAPITRCGSRPTPCRSSVDTAT
jgi:acyl-CoA dehydrogenase